MKPRCSKVIVVEGKYDKIRIESLLDATVITTEGFGIFKNEEKRALFKRLAEKRGLVILSDPDGAGKVIRGHLHTLTGGRGITDLYVPPTVGKERRKSQSSKEGLLGVEGIDNETLLALFEKSGLLEDGQERAPAYTKTDLYRLGYFGKDDSKSRREAVLSANALPKNLSSTAFLDIINLLEIPL
ncbi:MAG: DUF4093 domain-containing protein [Ruminococcaceae bacterium]|nr:DUF4093 domain-containing protein [Oscillospiraceae bacterium]